MSDAIGLEKVMTFEEWIRQECFKAPPEYAVELAKAAWDYQQARIEALEKAAKADQQARIESLTEGIKRTTALYNDLENAEIEGDDESCGVIRHQLDRSIEDMAALLEEGE